MKVGDTFGSLTAVRKLHPNKRKEYLWEFNCLCGNTHQAVGTVVKRQAKIITNPEVPSCGCINVKVATKLGTKHGYAYDPLYQIYMGMYQRCYNPNNERYALYGGSDVTICSEWLGHPETFIEWAKTNGWRSGLQLDKDILCDKLKIHPKIYSPETCQFISLKDNTKYSASRETARPDNKRIILTVDEVNRIRNLYSKGDISQDMLAAQFGVSQATIWYVINKKRRIPS